MIRGWSVPFAAVPLALGGLLAVSPLHAQEATPPVKPVAVRDGSHDFDFERGTWKLHIHRLLHPLTGSADWADYDGTKTDIPIWGGKANISEVEASGPAGHLEFLALRLYAPSAHQWNLYFANSRTGVLSNADTGEMRDGRIEFVGTDTLDGRAILVRFVMQPEEPGKASSRQYFSGDGGHTWELNWINTYTQIKS